MLVYFFHILKSAFFFSYIHSEHMLRVLKTPHTHTPLCSYSFLILYLNDELVKNEESDLGSKSA